MTWSASEMMTVAAARALTERRHLLRRHRAAVGRLQSRAADARAAPDARLRVGNPRNEAPRAAAVDWRRRALRNRADHRVRSRDVPVLAAGRTYHRRLPRRRAGRSLRQLEQHGDRRLREAEGTASGQRRRHRDLHVLPAHLHRDAPRPAVVRAEARFPDLARPRPDRSRTARTGRHDRGAVADRDGPLHDASRSGEQGVRGGHAPSRRSTASACRRTPAGRFALPRALPRRRRRPPRNWRPCAT